MIVEQTLMEKHHITKASLEDLGFSYETSEIRIQLVKLCKCV